MWDGWAAALKDRFRIIRFDIPGYGLTGADPTDDYSIDRTIELIGCLADRLGVDQFCIAGTSVGGVVAFRYAAEFPQRATSLILANSGGMPRKAGSGPNQGVKDTFLTRLMLRWVTVDFSQRLRGLTTNQSIVTDALIAQYAELNRARGNRSRQIKRVLSFATGNPEAVLKNVRVPTLIQWATGGGGYLENSEADQFSAWLVNAPRVIRKTYPDSGHLLPLEVPAKSARDAADFLAGNMVGT